MTCEEQIRLWVSGNSVHNDERDECCPDFSCCEPKLQASSSERLAFESGDENKRHEMLMTFLGRMIAVRTPNKSIYLTV